jgi:hypothetical protein
VAKSDSIGEQKRKIIKKIYCNQTAFNISKNIRQQAWLKLPEQSN